MQLPTALQMAIEHLAKSLNFRQLSEARDELTNRYRRPVAGTQFMTTEAQRQSYVISRMPATYAAIQSCLKAIQERIDLPIKSLLDLGAGPGTGMWALCNTFSEIEKVTLIEKDQALIKLGKELTQFSDQKELLEANWVENDLETLTDYPSHDFVLLSYSIGELNSQAIQPLLDLCLKATNQLLLIVEPGTPVGFERMRMIRQYLIQEGKDKGFALIAPCPHQSTCPMTDGDWCHFPARVERSSLHRRLKEGQLGYEDEKFSYIAMIKHPSVSARSNQSIAKENQAGFSLPEARIIRQPIRHSGHVELKLCTQEEGVQLRTISKKMGETYKKARKGEWGDSLDHLGRRKTDSN